MGGDCPQAVLATMGPPTKAKELHSALNNTKEGFYPGAPRQTLVNGQQSKAGDVGGQHPSRGKGGGLIPNSSGAPNRLPLRGAQRHQKHGGSGDHKNGGQTPLPAHTANALVTEFRNSEPMKTSQFPHGLGSSQGKLQSH